MIIDSANMQCDNCGIKANHPVFLMPEGWTADRSVNPVQHFCSVCSTTRSGQMNRRSTDYQAIPAPDYDSSSVTVATHVYEAAHCYSQAYLQALAEFEDFVVQSIADAIKLDVLANDATVLFRRYLTARIDYKMITSPIDRSAQ